MAFRGELFGDFPVVYPVVPWDSMGDLLIGLPIINAVVDLDPARVVPLPHDRVLLPDHPQHAMARGCYSNVLPDTSREFGGIPGIVRGC